MRLSKWLTHSELGEQIVDIEKLVNEAMQIVKNCQALFSIKDSGSPYTGYWLAYFDKYDCDIQACKAAQEVLGGHILPLMFNRLHRETITQHFFEQATA